MEECLIDGVGLLKESRKASYPQQAEAKPQYHPSKCASIESDCKEQNRTLAAFLPKPPNTGFGDVRCRIGAELLFILFFFSFFIFLVLFQFFCIFDLSLQYFSSYSVFVFSTESDIPLPFFGEGTLFSIASWYFQK